MSNRNLAVLAGLAIASLAGSVASASPVGNIIFATGDGKLKYYDNGTISTLVDTAQFPYSGTDLRLGSITQGPSGEYYVGNGPFPVDINNNKSTIFRVDNIFGASSVSTLATNYPLANPGGMLYNANSNNLVVVNNPQSSYNDANPTRGVVAVNISNGAQTVSYNQPPFTTPPTVWRTASDIEHNPFISGGNDYYVACINGGDADYSPFDTEASTMWKFHFDPGTLQGTATLLVNFVDTGVTGLAGKLSFVRSLSLKESTREMFIADALQGIFKMQLDSSGNLVPGSLVLLNNSTPRAGGVKWNPYTDKVVFTDENTGNIYQMNTDGSAFETVASGIDAGGVYFVPAPGALALMGFGAMAAGRRRR